MTATVKVPAYLVTITGGVLVMQPCTELDYLCMSYEQAVRSLHSGQSARSWQGATHWPSGRRWARACMGWWWWHDDQHPARRHPHCHRHCLRHRRHAAGMVVHQRRAMRLPTYARAAPDARNDRYAVTTAACVHSSVAAERGK